MKIQSAAKVAAVSLAIGMAAGAAGEMYMMKSGKMKQVRKKANRTMRAVENIVDDVKEFFE